MSGLPSRRRVLKGALAALFLIPLFVSGTVEAGEIFAREPLTITGADGASHVFNVELALTEAQREQGLMFRRMMGENEGMLFDFGETRMVYMWMKNTVLPLDMGFMDKDGVVTHLHSDAVPYSEAIISSVSPVKYVLELSAGTIKRLHLSKGDRATSAEIAGKP